MIYYIPFLSFYIENNSRWTSKKVKVTANVIIPKEIQDKMLADKKCPASMIEADPLISTLESLSLSSDDKEKIAPNTSSSVVTA